MIDRIKKWKSTALGVLIGLGLYALVWFEKLPDDWLTQLSVLVPVLIGMLSKK